MPSLKSIPLKLLLLIIISINLGEIAYALYQEFTFVGTDNAGYDSFAMGVSVLIRILFALTYLIPAIFLAKKKKWAWYFIGLISASELLWYSQGYRIDFDLGISHRVFLASASIILLLFSRRQLNKSLSK
jgi:hypothetical protein